MYSRGIYMALQCAQTGFSATNYIATAGSFVHFLITHTEFIMGARKTIIQHVTENTIY